MSFPRALAAFLTIVSISGQLLAQDVTYPDFSSTLDLTLLESATRVGDELRLTDEAEYERAAVWYETKLPLAGGFDTVFTLRIDAPQSPSTAPGCIDIGQADGLAFVIQNNDLLALGDTGFGLGYASAESTTPGISNSIAIEFDTWRNVDYGFTNEFDEVDDNHISVQTMGALPNVADPDFALAYGVPSVDINEGLSHEARIIYVPGQLRVLLDGELVIDQPLDLTSNPAFDGSGTTYAGFTSATGQCYQSHFLTSWALWSGLEVFIDGFESGDVSAWSNLGPGF